MPDPQRRLTAPRHVESPDDNSRGDSTKVLIYEAEARRIARFVYEYPDLETGGDLFGYWTHSGAPVISYVIGPGRGSSHNLASFYQDPEWLYDVGVDLYDRHGIQHVGEWHSHHRLGLNEPSGGDVRTVRLGMKEKSWSRFLLMIATLDAHPDSPVLQNYYLFSRDGDYRPARIVVLPGGSPFRSGADDPREEPARRHVADVRWRPGPLTPTASHVRKVADVYPGAWFTAESGQRCIRQIVTELDQRGIKHRIRTSGDGRCLKFSLPSAELMLGPDFPGDPPQVLAGPSAGHLPWPAPGGLVGWYLSLESTVDPLRQRTEHEVTETGASPGTRKEEIGDVRRNLQQKEKAAENEQEVGDRE